MNRGKSLPTQWPIPARARVSEHFLVAAKASARVCAGVGVEPQIVLDLKVLRGLQWSVGERPLWSCFVPCPAVFVKDHFEAPGAANTVGGTPLNCAGPVNAEVRDTARTAVEVLCDGGLGQAKAGGTRQGQARYNGREPFLQVLVSFHMFFSIWGLGSIPPARIRGGATAARGSIAADQCFRARPLVARHRYFAERTWCSLGQIAN